MIDEKITVRFETFTGTVSAGNWSGPDEVLVRILNNMPLDPDVMDYAPTYSWLLAIQAARLFNGTILTSFPPIDPNVVY